ncbi:MAG: twin-arginine translocase TatA/TatE family subunit [Deltaproteobacteria bacterium]|nr:twin-arginine translocase TatA/TatE family subunit [Deltaproteobacteria bacterium]
MLGVGVFEILMVLIVALLVLGPDQLPKAARALAKMVFEFRQASEDLRLGVMGAEEHPSKQDSHNASG